MLNVPFPQQSWSDVTVTSETVLWETHILKLYLGNYSLGEKHLIELMVVIEFHFFFFSVEDFCIFKNKIALFCEVA